MQAIAAPQPIAIPEITFSVDLPVLPTLLESPEMDEIEIEDPIFDIATLPVPEPPSQDVFQIGDTPAPVDLNKILTDLDLSDLYLPEAPIITTPTEIAAPALNVLAKPEKPVFDEIGFPEFPTLEEFPKFPEFNKKIELPSVS